jgi:hypothetical protein
MSVTKLSTAAVVLVFVALGTPASASAGWFVEGEEVTTAGAALATTAKVDQSSVLKGSGVAVTCSGATLNSVSPEIVLPNKITASSLEFTGCSAAAPCSLTKPAITTEPVVAELTEQAPPAVPAILKPKTGTRITRIDLEGEECAFAGETSVTGQARVLLPTGQEKNELQALVWEAKESTGELKLGSASASLAGSALLKLVSGSSFLYTPPDLPRVLLRRVAGLVPRQRYRCIFVNRGETCELSLTVTNTVNNVALTFIGDKLEKLGPNNLEFNEKTPATNPKCNKGTLIGGRGASCYIKIEYAGVSNPGAGQYLACYTAETQENGGGNRIATDWELLEAEERNQQTVC